ncbi:hypothetical protein GIB67_033865 [Kingdonia uniflora]|uniref:Uncharacterized protein n=1 Tax=Kingdonia uniflora TaxID=39325 RepID=A0A7J7MIW9_9MAGN|nr:hypothetical protein GIB67_033865 [Kingdonia uniflora]
MSMSISILAKMMKCSPSHVTSLVLKRNIFDVALNANKVDLGSNISGTWFLSGGLATMLLIDCEHTSDYCPLTVSVLDFTMQLMETGADNDIVLALVVFSLQYVFVNHEHWRYKSKDVRWKVTLKVLEVMKKCITLIPVSGKLGGTIRDILLCDTSIHNKLCRLICINKRALENLFVGRLYEVEEIEGIQLAVSYSLEIVFTVLDVFSKDAMTSVPVFHQAMLSSTAKPISVFSAVMSLISYSHNPAIQIGAAKVISSLCIVAENAKPYLLGNVCLVSDDTQIADLRYSIYEILSEETPRNKDLSIATLRLLISAARHQPPFLISIMSTEDNNAVLLSNSGGIKEHSKKVLSRPLESKNVGLVETMMCYVKRFEDLIERHPHFLLNLLNFLEVLWDGATQYVQILDFFKASEVFWNKLSSILAISTVKSPFVAINGDGNLCLAFKFQCHSSALNIMAFVAYLDLYAHMRGVYAMFAYCLNISIDIAATLLLVHLMGKLTVGDGGSLSVSLIEKIQSMSTKLSEQPAFSRLLAQYSSHGYSEEKDLKNLLLSDLYYHIQGELEGRKINPGPFDELGQYLFELKFLLPDEHKHISKYPEQSHDVYVYDLVGLRADLSTEFWDHSDWKTSKEIAERTLKYMHDANLMAYLAGSKLLALKSLTTILYVYMENETSVGGMNPEPLIRSCIDHVCKCLQTTIKSLVPAVNPSDVSIDFLGAEAELLLCLVRLSNKRLLKNANQEMSASICSCIIKTSCAGLRLLSSIRPSVVGRSKTIKLFLILLLTSIETAHSGSLVKEQGNEESVLSSLGLLPILCDCVEAPEYCTLSLAIIDYLLKSYLTYDTWFPIIQNHLHLRVLIQKLLEKESVVSIPIILKFLLSLARIRGGAEMLVSANFFSAFKIVISHLIDEKRVISFQDNKDEQPSQIWGLGLAIVAAMVHSLGDSTSSVDLVDIMIPYFFSEKTYLMFYHLNALDIPSVDHDKKRPRSQKQVTSLTALKETEQTLMLICVLAKSKNLWIKVMKETVSQLRERCIHILAFISRGVHRIGESPSRTISLLCPPILKNDIELNRSPSFVNSKQGWFSTMAKTSFTDTVAIQMYRIALLLLNFLCLQVKETTKRAEEVGYIDLAHFPELPMPEILHYLQDHAIVIVTELCQADKLKEKQPVILEVCLLLLQIMEKSLYLEHCVSHTCEIRPVLGRVEDFSKEIKMFMHGTMMVDKDVCNICSITLFGAAHMNMRILQLDCKEMYRSCVLLDIDAKNFLVVIIIEYLAN